MDLSDWDEGVSSSFFFFLIDTHDVNPAKGLGDDERY